MRGHLIWSMRQQVAKFIEDENGKFIIVNGQIEPFRPKPEIEYTYVKRRREKTNERIRVVDNSEELRKISKKLKRIEEQTRPENPSWYQYGGM